jgi:hypothetical protein
LEATVKVTIIPSDGKVGVDGVFRSVSMAGIDPSIHAVQFDTRGGGHVEFKQDLNPRPDNQKLASIAAFQVFLDRWTAAEPPPPPPPPTPTPPPDLLDQFNALSPQRRAALLVELRKP